LEKKPTLNWLHIKREGGRSRRRRRRTRGRRKTVASADVLPTRMQGEGLGEKINKQISSFLKNL
jgi:hypothetical protein